MNPLVTKAIKRFVIVAFVLLLITAGVLAWIATHATPMVRRRAIAMLQNRFDSDVEIQDLRVTLFPSISVHGAGLTLRHHGRRDVPPLIAVHEFSAHETWPVFLGRPWHLQRVRLGGVTIHMPPRTNDPKAKTEPQKAEIPVSVDELLLEDAELDILPNDPQKRPHIFVIHSLTLHSVGLGRSAPFEAVLTNDTPPGDISAKGQFGPWHIEDPRQTPLSATYTFSQADLGVFRGIAGTLSSTGKFGGVLEKIEIEGETTVPDFVVDVGGHRRLLKTQFNATVDGTNGNTLLHPVLAFLGRSILSSNGGVVKALDKKGREIVLDVATSHARLEDLLALAVKADPPPMTGAVSLRTHLDLPPGSGDIADRLTLRGEFGVLKGQFTEPSVREKLENLSRKAQGQPHDEDAGSAISDLGGKFALKNGVMTFRGLSFRITGAAMQLDGTYGLRDEKLDFHGKVRLDAKLSQMTTGFKSFLLKPFDSHFRKNGATELPIRITGTRASPSFGLDFHNKTKSGKVGSSSTPRQAASRSESHPPRLTPERGTTEPGRNYFFSANSANPQRSQR